MAARREPCRLAARPRACRRAADAVARTAEGADPQRRACGRRSAGPRSGDQGSRRRSSSSWPSPNRGPRITKRRTSRSTIAFEDEHLLVVDKPAGLVVHPAAGQFRRDTGQCAAPPLRRQPVGDRRRRAAGHRPPDRQGHVRPAGRSPRPTLPMKVWRGSSRRTRIDRRYLAIVSGDSEPGSRQRSTPRSRARRPTARRSRSSGAAAASARSRTGGG